MNLIGKTVAWMTKDFGAVMGKVTHVEEFPDRPSRVTVDAESCEKNCRLFDKYGLGRWSVLLSSVQMV
jgi:hypothetical protein